MTTEERIGILEARLAKLERQMVESEITSSIALTLLAMEIWQGDPRLQSFVTRLDTLKAQAKAIGLEFD